VNKIKPKHIVWFIPTAYLAHLFDEYFSGQSLPEWFSGVFKVNLSLSDFIIINSFGLAATILIAVLYSMNKVNNFGIAALGTLFFVNGIIHPAASVLTASYSPGTITGLIIYLPLSLLIFKNFFTLLEERQRTLSIATGITIQILVAAIAFSI
jgi:hypothetical protein